MEKELIIQIAGIFLGGVGTVLVGGLLWGLKLLITGVYNATVELKVINQTLVTLVEDNKALPKMKEDINALHSKVRKLHENHE